MTSCGLFPLKMADNPIKWRIIWVINYYLRKSSRTTIFGEIDDVDIDTVYIERYNLTLRHGILRLARKSPCFSKCKEMLDNHLDVYQCYNNLIRVNSALTIKTKKGEKNILRTPCIAEDITDHIWTWEKLLMFKTDHET